MGDASVPIVPQLHADILYTLFQFFSYNELATSISNVCRLWRLVATKRMRKLIMFEFIYEGLSPVEASAFGSYPSWFWQEDYWLRRWNVILRRGYQPSETLPLPPLVLNEEIVDNGAVVIIGERRKDDLWIRGGYHPSVLKNVPPLNIELHLSLTFVKEDNRTWNAEKEVIATMEHGSELEFDTCWPWIFILYDVPFYSFSSTSAPVATNISIRKISPEQKWFYWGLAPRFSHNGKFDTIDCKSLHGTFDCTKEWEKMVEDNFYLAVVAGIYLPPLVLTSGIVENEAALCLFGGRHSNTFKFYVKFHPSTPSEMKSIEMLFKIDFHVKTRSKSMRPKNSNSTLRRHAETKVTLERDSNKELFSFDLPWTLLLSSSLPLVTISILPARAKHLRNRKRVFTDHLSHFLRFGR